MNSVGDTTRPDNLCKSVKSVGEHLSRVKSAGFFLHHTSVNSVGDTTHPDNLCKSVKSVGEHLSRVKSAGEHLSRMESVGALRIGILFAKTIFVVFDPPYFAKNQKQNPLSVFREF